MNQSSGNRLRWQTVLFAAMLLIATAAHAADPAEKLPIPDAAAQKRAAALVTEIFGGKVAQATSAEQKSALAHQMIETAGRTADPAGKFVLMRQAAQLAAESGDVSGTLGDIDAASQVFKLDGSFIADVLRPLATSAHAPEEQAELMNSIVSSIDSSVAVDDYDGARKLALLGQQCGGRSKETAIRTRAGALLREVEQIENAYKAQQKLPPGPAADDARGRLDCLLKGDWKTGLPLLAAGTDARTRALAKADLDAGDDADRRAKAADGWWNLAEGEGGLPGRRLRERALVLYRQAMPDLTGITKLRASRRIDEAEAAGAIKPAQISQLIVEALIDGNSELHLTPQGIYWVEKGVAKPGRHDGANEPTYLNGQPWMPQWGQPNKDRGNDRTTVLPMPIGTLNFDVQVLAIGMNRGDEGIERRDPVTIRTTGNEQIVSIPDGQIDARWYKVRIFRKEGGK